MQAARGHSGGVGGAGLTEEQRLRIAANRQKALDKRASKSAGAPGPLALAALPHVGGGADGVATAVLVPGEQQMAGGAAAGAQHGLRLADALATASDSDREPPRYFRSTCRHVIRSVRPRPRVHG